MTTNLLPPEPLFQTTSQCLHFHACFALFFPERVYWSHWLMALKTNPHSKYDWVAWLHSLPGHL
jgi:hypothetical protein